MPMGIDLSTLLQKSLDRALFYTFLYTRFDRVAFELLSLLCTFENSTECSKISFDSDILFRRAKGSIGRGGGYGFFNSVTIFLKCEENRSKLSKK